MNLNNEMLVEERSKLKEVKNWLSSELKNKENYKNKLEEKLKGLKRASRGSYNEELENTKGIFALAEKHYNNYKEAQEQPYFARIDFREYAHSPEKLYIGKFSLSEEKTGEEIVIDWRAPIADLYYSGTETEAYYKAPQGVISGELLLKRKFLFRDEDISEIFDEGLNDIIIKSSLGEEALIDEFLRITLEESTGSKLKDVVATIQKEQNEIIRAEKNIPIIVQGSAGSGKTTVALHRLAYLLYRYKEILNGDNILVVAPNMIFLDYISLVLPSLGVDEVKQSTFENFAKEVLGRKEKLYSKDKKLAWVLENKDNWEYKYVVNASKVKGSLLYKTVIDRFLKIIERTSGFLEDLTYKNNVIFPVEDIKKLYYKELNHLPVDKRLEELIRYYKGKLDSRIKDIQEKTEFQYEYLIARTKKTLEDSTERRLKLIELYDERDKAKKAIKEGIINAFKEYFRRSRDADLLQLYSKLYLDEEIFNEATGGIIPKPLANYMRESFKSNLQKGVLDGEDLYGILYLKIIYQGLQDKFKFSHIVIDEAQDYSPFELMVISKFTSFNSLTLVGDIGQGIYYYKGISSWDQIIKEIFNDNALYMPLTQSYRSTIEIIELANEVLSITERDIKPPKAVLRHGKKPEIIKFTNIKDIAHKLDSIVESLHNKGRKSTAIICRDLKSCEILKDNLKRYSVLSWEVIGDNNKALSMENMILPAFLTKGLEFDCTIIYDCNIENYSKDKEEGRLLYVALTRALHEEYIIYNNEPSELIKGYMEKHNEKN